MRLLIPVLLLLMTGCQTYRFYETFDPNTGALTRRDGFANGVVTKPTFNLGYTKPDGTNLSLQYARENDIEAFGAAIGAGVRAAGGLPTSPTPLPPLGSPERPSVEPGPSSFPTFPVTPRRNPTTFPSR